MQSLKELENGAYGSASKIKLPGLTTFPLAILECETLEFLDLSGGQLSTLPDGLCKLKKLKILFLSDNHFHTYPSVLAHMPALEMVAFKNNGMREIGEESLNKKLRWLILTNNQISSLPECIGQCTEMQKLMLAGNCLTRLPESMRQLRRLELLRLSVNMFEELPDWLFGLPRLAFLAFAGNPMKSFMENTIVLPEVEWTDLQLGAILGEGASGTISRATWLSPGQDVAVKVFKATVTSDGSPEEEMRACIRAGKHRNLIDTIAEVGRSGKAQRALVLQLIPKTYEILGQPPSFASCTRDCYAADLRFVSRTMKSILSSVASAATHLHSHGISHGDLYAHNTLVNKEGHGLLGDLGAATCYGQQHPQAAAIERLEVRAFGYMMEDLLSRCDENHDTPGVKRLRQLRFECTLDDVLSRPDFRQICAVIDTL